MMRLRMGLGQERPAATPEAIDAAIAEIDAALRPVLETALAGYELTRDSKDRAAKLLETCDPSDGRAKALEERALAANRVHHALAMIIRELPNELFEQYVAEANCGIDYPSEEEQRFRVAIMRRIGRELGLREVKDLRIDGDAPGRPRPPAGK
jgi:hypothetical protein